MIERPNTDTNSRMLSPDQLYRRCDESKFSFETTDEVDSPEYPFVGQERALASAIFGIKMKRDGFNIYALGPEETDKQILLDEVIIRAASGQKTPSDWCYVCNFKEEYKPVALELPSGDAVRFRNLMHRFAEDLPNVLTGAFESEEYQNRRQSIEEDLSAEEHEDFSELQKKAKEQGLKILSTPGGYTFAPLKDGKIMTAEELQKLPEEEKKNLEQKIQDIQKELQMKLRQIPERKRKFREMREKLNRRFAGYSIKGILDEIRNEFKNQQSVLQYLKQAEEDILNHVEMIINPGGGNPFLQAISGGKELKSSPPTDHPVLWRYTVNVMVDHSESDGAPLIYEDNPTYKNLIGRIEHVSEMGTLSTDFTYIKPGALHRANGGYLILDAMRVLTQPYAWDGLKRALQSDKIKVESPGDMYGLISALTLEPAPIDLDVKVILTGNRLLYYLLCIYDQDFKNLFKVEVDFEDEMDWSDENQELYARLIAELIRKNELNPMDKSAVARIIEHASRLVSDNQKMTTQMKVITDLLRESDFWSRQEGDNIIRKDAVQKAIEQRKYRSGRLKDRYQEEILRKSIFIDTEGTRIGQVNGLSVARLGNSQFGHPTRITARVRLGKGEVVNIEREVEMSGPIHSKGVLILSAFLGARYSIDKPLSLSASLVFEQSYGGVEGDSASSTELYALLSAIAETPLKQSIAVTGSVNQHGVIQPIGGVNEKIEGFFEICSNRGLTGDQGVLIPEANMKNLMLKEEVVQAVGEEKFHIYAIKTIDGGMELLTDLQMGTPDNNGEYPDGSVNYLVEKSLSRFASLRQKYSAESNGKAEK